MRVSWRCDYCRRLHYHPTSEKKNDERKPIRNSNRLFDTETCIVMWDKVTRKMAVPA